MTTVSEIKEEIETFLERGGFWTDDPDDVAKALEELAVEWLHFAQELDESDE